MPGHDVVVTGLGLLTPAGIGAAASWAGLCAGRPTAATDPELAGVPVDFSCALPDFTPEVLLGGRLVMRTDRFVHMGLVAAREALDDAGISPADWDPQRVGVVIGVSTGSMEAWAPPFASVAAGCHEEVSPFVVTRTLPNMAAAEISIDLGAQGPSLAVGTACASGATAIGVARDLVRSGTCDIVITGGSEATRVPIVATCFGQAGALSRRGHDPAGASRPFDVHRDGFVLGEGAGVLVLERAEHARARGARAAPVGLSGRAVTPPKARIRAVLTGYGASSDAHHFAAPHPEGRGAELAMRAALRDAALAPDGIDHVNAHGTSTPRNDLAEAFALHRVFRTPPAVTANKSVFGHALGGAGAIEAVCTVLTLQEQLIPPTANLEHPDPQCDLDVVTGSPRQARVRAAMSNSFGFGGQNAVLVFQTP
ncbi:beta-ketoacyl-[acyl-carrier-protein] synthase family protein [Streptomyces virginiae]|uniref:beta-ketoacyl-[acyl-carrier-protein] synthase family protein n=1 Tax=Streptomyces virginiae TaxID=1961 RepID=UPI00365EAE8C